MRSLIDGGRAGVGREVGDVASDEAGGMVNGRERSVMITAAQYAPLFLRRQ